jgi:hypothetical protein
MFLSIHFMRSYGTILPSIILMDLSEMSECMCSSSVFCLREFFILFCLYHGSMCSSFQPKGSETCFTTPLFFEKNLKLFKNINKSQYKSFNAAE